MKSIDKHIYFSDKMLVQRVEEYRIINQITFSDAVCNLLEIALDNLVVAEELYKISKNIDYLINILKNDYALLQQFYSDFDTENITNPRNSKPLKEFFNKINGRDKNE